MRFPSLIQEEILQVNDKTRFDMSKTFVTPDEGDITAIEISFDDATFINVFVGNEDEPENWFLDYAFNIADAAQDVFVRVTTGAGNTKIQSTIEVISEDDDKLFSTDAQLFSEEGELIDYLKPGKATYKYAHRNSQRNIIRYLDGEGIRKDDGVAFVKDDLVLNAYIREMSIYETLISIFEDQKVRGVDVFDEKKKSYETKLTSLKKNARIKLDYNGDGEIGDTEERNIQNKFLTR